MAAERYFWQGDTLWSRDFPITGELMKHTGAYCLVYRGCNLIQPQSPRLEKICSNQYSTVVSEMYLSELYSTVWEICGRKRLYTDFTLRQSDALLALHV